MSTEVKATFSIDKKESFTKTLNNLSDTELDECKQEIIYEILETIELCIDDYLTIEITEVN